MRVTSQLPRVRPGNDFPADPDFPQLAIASDPQRMLELFRRHLEPAAGKRYRIEDCVPLRFRCRQSTARCVLQYTLHLLEPGTGRRCDQGVTGLLYAQKGAAERLWREMQAADPSQGIPDDWLTFQPVGFIPDLEMVVQVFPYDRKLRNLRLVLGGALRDLEPQLLARLAPGEWRVTERTMAPTRYRTELGAALNYTLQACDAATGDDRRVGAARARRPSSGDYRRRSGRAGGGGARADSRRSQARPCLLGGRPGDLHRPRFAGAG